MRLEPPLEPGAQAVLLTASVDRTTRRCADGRRPLHNTADLFGVGVHQVRAGDRVADVGPATTQPVSSLDTRELTILTSWAEALADAIALAPDRVDRVLADARGGAPWRSRAGVDEPSPELAAALDALGRATTGSGDGDVTVERARAATHTGPDEVAPSGRLALRLLRSALESRHSS